MRDGQRMDGRYKKYKGKCSGYGIYQQAKTSYLYIGYNRYQQAHFSNKTVNDDKQNGMDKEAAAKEKIVYTGFIAQDVEKLAKEVSFDFSGVDVPKNETDLYGLRYAEFVVPIVKGMQELSAENDSLKTELTTLKEKVAKMELFLSNQGTGTFQLTGSSLFQNAPNPFRGNTTISYNLPQQYSKAMLIVYDAAHSAR